MNKRYSDSLIPFGIGTSFTSILVLLLSAGATVGYLIKGKYDFQQAGGICLLIIFLILFVGPVLYNRKKSRFEHVKAEIDRYDGMGTIQGLRGAFFRIIVYEEGLEIRAFYHRYFIPYDRVKKITIEDGYINKRLTVVTGISGIPDYISTADEKFLKIALLIEMKTQNRLSGWMENLFKDRERHE